MTENKLERYIRLSHENAFYGGFIQCPLCGMSSASLHGTQVVCRSCGKSTDIDEVTK